MLPRCIPQFFWRDDRFGLMSVTSRYVFLGLVFNVNDHGRIYYDTLTLTKLLYLDDRSDLIFHLLQLQSSNLIHTDNADVVINDWWQFIGVDEADNLRQQIYGRDDYQCVYCGGPPQHLDHIQAKSKKGKDAPSNLVTACRSCNTSKNARQWRVWYQSQTFYDESKANYINKIRLS